jgi:hypothetical protein
MEDAYAFLSDLKMRLRESRIQLTTDGLGHYLRVVDGLWTDNIDFAMLHKIYGHGLPISHLSVPIALRRAPALTCESSPVTLTPSESRPPTSNAKT